MGNFYRIGYLRIVLGILRECLIGSFVVGIDRLMGIVLGSRYYVVVIILEKFKAGGYGYVDC